MRKRILALALAMAVLLGLAWQSVYAANSTSGATTAERWFYNQLEPRAQQIYNALEDAYTTGKLKDGKASIELTGMNDAAAAYLKGNRSLFNDFSAAKDAFDLEHPEAWYFDSAQLSLTAVGTSTSATASMGTGKSDSYYVLGVKDSADVTAKTTALEAKVKTIADAARMKSDTYEQIKYVHDQVINGISYKYEFECTPGNAGFIRTAYVLVTGEGVCEGYVRSFQMILNELGIPCVPIHGMQTSDDDPQQHMWCAVYIDNAEKGTGWYVVDPTWDDPLPDGHERDDYFMVGNDVIAANWIPSGYVSTGAMEFSYPPIAPRSYGAGEISSNGLVVTYNDGLMEGTASTVYNISYNGMGVYQAAQKGYHLLVKLYDINADGSEEGFEDWYYLYNSLYILSGSPGDFDKNNNLQNTGNPYHYDTDSYVVEEVSNCEYVEFAVTELAPKLLTEGFDALAYGYLSDSGGTEADIIAQTGLIYNPNGTYEQPPYAKNVTPKQTESTYVGATHTIHMEFTDPLYHPDQAAINNATAIGKVNEAEDAMKETVGLDYTGTNYSWGVNGGLPHTFSVKPEPQNVRWYCETHGIHRSMTEIKAYGSACRLTTLEFEFTPSKMWADDSVAYQFYLTGLVGVKSNKKPVQTGMSFVFENESAFCAYRCVKKGGIDWNLWGQPQLLDDPNNLDFSKMVVEGINGNEQSIEELYGNVNLDQYDMNGRLLLVVEDASTDNAKAAAMSELLEGAEGVNLQETVASALYEIDFARICGQTIVETGQSLRMQVGFPAGFDTSKLSTTEFKVYHFIKDKTTGEITGVEEIPVTVTPYGLVFQVSSFSPFAIAAEEGKADNSRSVVLVSGGNGTITSNYTPGSNEVDGTLTLSPNDSYEITITPDAGYAVESITATGYTVSAINSKGGTFTLSYDEIGASNAMIGVTFVETAKSDGTVETVSLCGHEAVTTSEKGTPATCTTDGVTPTVTCADCGQVLSGGEVIQATGHVYKIPENYQEPTCEKPGTELKCTVCGATSQAPALGHEYYKGVCTRCKTAEDGTVTTTVTDSKTGTSTVTVKSPDGSVSVTETDASGNISRSESFANGVRVSTKIPVGGSVSASVSVPAGMASASVIIKAPVTAGTVAVNRATGEVVMLSVPVDGGLKVVLDGSADIVLVDLSKDFADMPDSHWAADSVDFVTAHGLFYGTGGDKFSPNANMTRSMLMTVLARFNGVDTDSGSTWYGPGMEWAVANGISDGTNPNADITREQLAVMLYRYAGSPEVNGAAGNVSGYPDANEISDWAAPAMRWAVQNGIIQGSNGRLNPGSKAVRSEVSAMIERFCRNVAAEG